MADVAAYHEVYARETEHLAEVPASRKDHIEEWLGSRLARKLSIPDLSSEGWAFEGGRLLAEDGQPIAQLLYTAPGRQPIAVCITHSDQPESKPTEYDPGKGIRVAAWDAERIPVHRRRRFGETGAGTSGGTGKASLRYSLTPVLNSSFSFAVTQHKPASFWNMLFSGPSCQQGHCTSPCR